MKNNNNNTSIININCPNCGTIIKTETALTIVNTWDKNNTDEKTKNVINNNNTLNNTELQIEHLLNDELKVKSHHLDEIRFEILQTAIEELLNLINKREEHLISLPNGKLKAIGDTNMALESTIKILIALKNDIDKSDH